MLLSIAAFEDLQNDLSKLEGKHVWKVEYYEFSNNS